MELKTCPFCGGLPYVEESSRGYVNGESTKVCYIRCRKCNARSERVNIKDFGHTSRSEEALNLVVESWNRRAEFTRVVNIKIHAENREKKPEEPSLLRFASKPNVIQPR